MDRYLLNDILEYRDYMRWRKLIDEVNKEYHDKVYYSDIWKCLRCQRNGLGLWHWRGTGNYYGSKFGISHYSRANNRYKCRRLNIDLPKNY